MSGGYKNEVKIVNKIKTPPLICILRLYGVYT